MCVGDFDFVQIAADFNAEIRRADVVFADFSVFQLGNAGFARQRDFVQTAFAAHDQNVFGTKLFQYARQDAAQVNVEHAQELVRRTGRVGQRAQNIENTSKPERTAHGRDVAHRAVMVLGKHKAQACLTDAFGDLLRCNVQHRAHLLHHVRRAAGRGNGTPAVFGDFRACRSSDKHGSRGNIEGFCAVSARTDNIDEVV